MGFLDFMTKTQREEAQRLDPSNESKKVRSWSVDKLEEKVFSIAADKSAEIKNLRELIHSTENEIEKEQEAAAEAIKAGDYKDYSTHVSARRTAEEVLEGYRLRLAAISDVSAISKEDAVAYVRALGYYHARACKAAYEKAAKLIRELEELDEDHARRINRLSEIATVLRRDVLKGEELYFEDENGSRHYVDLMLADYSEKGRALRAIVYAMKRRSDEYSLITGEPLKADRSAFYRAY